MIPFEALSSCRSARERGNKLVRSACVKAQRRPFAVCHDVSNIMVCPSYFVNVYQLVGSIHS
jgi:hypothetical protein